MTNTLHRFGDAESFHDDFVVIAMACKGTYKQPNPLPGLKKFLQIAIEYKPVNLGDPRHGGAIRPSQSMNPFAHWSRDNAPHFQEVVDGLTDVTTCAAVFDNLDSAEKFLKRIRDEDLGLSVNISTSVEGADHCCHFASIPRHKRRLFARLRGQDREDAEHAGRDAVDDVRARHDQPLAREEDDRLREREPAHAGSRGSHTDPFLFVWRLQSIACEEDS